MRGSLASARMMDDEGARHGQVCPCPSPSRRVTGRDMRKQTLVPFHAFPPVCFVLSLSWPRLTSSSSPASGMCTHAPRCAMHVKKRISGGGTASFLAGSNGTTTGTACSSCAAAATWQRLELGSAGVPSYVLGVMMVVNLGIRAALRLSLRSKRCKGHALENWGYHHCRCWGCRPALATLGTRRSVSG